MKLKSVALLIVVFTLGIGIGAFARGSKAAVDSSMYKGKSKKEAAAALLEVAKPQAEKGSWENIAVGRAYYLGGMKQEGQAIFDKVTSGKAQGSDWLRIGRTYYEAGEWDKAKMAFDKAMAAEPKDTGIQAEVGAYYNLKGDRAKAEELFDKSFKAEPGEVWHTANAAGSYIGVVPQQ